MILGFFAELPPHWMRLLQLYRAGERLESDVPGPSTELRPEGSVLLTGRQFPDCHRFTLLAHYVMYCRRHRVPGPKMPGASVMRPTPAFGRIQCALIERPAGVRLEDIHDLLCGFIGLQDGMHMISPHMRS